MQKENKILANYIYNYTPHIYYIYAPQTDRCACVHARTHTLTYNITFNIICPTKTSKIGVVYLYSYNKNDVPMKMCFLAH